MTELSPLAELASAALIPWLIGVPIAWRRTGFVQALKRQTRKLAAVLAHMVLVPVGATLGIMALIAAVPMWMVYILVELWSLDAAEIPGGVWDLLASYSRRRFHRPQHAL